MLTCAYTRVHTIEIQIMFVDVVDGTVYGKAKSSGQGLCWAEILQVEVMISRSKSKGRSCADLIKGLSDGSVKLQAQLAEGAQFFCLTWLGQAERLARHTVFVRKARRPGNSESLSRASITSFRTHSQTMSEVQLRGAF